ncbi:hypothetical protein [Cupriavidus taiwanensis]|uniref:Uncharacterized protein n=1 Tax=Cupriavidus taiwanensis TaxID=164546 RepID=A0A375J2X5_9BURK|nr:hypothetical protein [Cupriavidus taiwanensis]SPR99534.1 conserved hypothetical protein [Cupriavidus taiwanensis]
MQRKVAVSGDVSQLVTGNVVHEAPATVQQQNNTVTYNLHSILQEPKYLSWRQRQVISSKVDEVAQAEGVERLAIYKTLLSDHDAQNMKVMPADRYRAIMDDLAVALSEAKSRAIAANDSATGPSELPSRNSNRDTSLATVPVQRTRLGALHWLLSICAAGAGGFLMWERVAAEPNIVQDVCQFEGRLYSVGSVTAMPPSGIYECQAAADTGPKWAPARNLGSGGKRRL